MIKTADSGESINWERKETGDTGMRYDTSKYMLEDKYFLSAFKVGA